MKLLTVSNPKTAKGAAQGWRTAIMHLSPASSGGINVCPHASDGCKAVCLAFQGRGNMSTVQLARVRKTEFWRDNRAEFIGTLHTDIGTHARRARKAGQLPAVRLNGFSDLPWERIAPELFADYPDVQFYDYTKVPGRFDLPANYHLTFSRSECNEAHAREALRNGQNVAVVFRDTLPAEFWGYEVISGDDTDLRFLDPSPRVVGLVAKGRARHDTSGFVT